MAVRTTRLARIADGILDWFGPKRATPACAQSQFSKLPVPGEPQDETRARQLEEVVQFITSNQLPVSAASLAVTFNYLNGKDSRLFRAVERRLKAGRALNQEWLEEQLGKSDRGEDIALLSQLIQRLENSIDELAATSRNAHNVTSQYHSALKEHVSDLEQVSNSGAVISELANIAKVMVRRTRELERQMLRSDAQTRALRRSNARAATKAQRSTPNIRRRSPNRPAQPSFIRRHL